MGPMPVGMVKAEEVVEVGGRMGPRPVMIGGVVVVEVCCEVSWMAMGCCWGVKGRAKGMAEVKVVRVLEGGGASLLRLVWKNR